MWDDELRARSSSGAPRVLAADPASWSATSPMGEEGVGEEGASRKVDGGEQSSSFPGRSPLQLCLRGRSPSPAFGRAGGTRSSPAPSRLRRRAPQLVAIAARLFAADKRKLEVTPPAAGRAGQLAAWQTGIVEDAVPAIATAIAAGTGGRAALCDVCNATTSSERAIAVTAGEFREIVARGFEMDEGAIRLARGVRGLAGAGDRTVEARPGGAVADRVAAVPHVRGPG